MGIFGNLFGSKKVSNSIQEASEVQALLNYIENEEWSVAMDYFYGRNGRVRNVKKAINMLEMGVEKFYCCDAKFCLAHIDIIGAPPYRPQNIESGVSAMFELAKEGYTEAFMWLMHMFRYGRPYEGVPFEKDEARAGKYAIEIANSMDAFTDNMVNGEINGTAAWAYFHGHGVAINYVRAREYYNRINPIFLSNRHLKEIGDELLRLGY